MCAFITRAEIMSEAMGKHFNGQSMKLFSLEIPNYKIAVLVERAVLGLGYKSSPSGIRMLTSNVNRT